MRSCHRAGRRLPAQPGPAERQPRAVPPRSASWSLAGRGDLRRRRVQAGLLAVAVAGIAAVQGGHGPAHDPPGGLGLLAPESQVGAAVVRWRRGRGWRSPTRWFIYALLGTISFYADRIPFGGIGGTIRTALLRPGRFWTPTCRATAGSFYLWQMGVSFGLGSPARARDRRHRAAGPGRERAQHLPLHAPDPVPLLDADGARAGPGHGLRRRRRSRRPGAATWPPAWSWPRPSCHALFWGLAPFSRQIYPHMNPTRPRCWPSITCCGWCPRMRSSPPTTPTSPIWTTAPGSTSGPPRSGPVLGRCTPGGPAAAVRRSGPVPGPARDLSPPDQGLLASIAGQFAMIGEQGGVVVYRRTSGPSARTGAVDAGSRPAAANAG